MTPTKDRDMVRDQLKRAYDDVTRERIPDNLRKLLEKLT